MPHWLIKAAAQRVISWLPYRYRVNEWFQEHITHSLDLSSERFEYRLQFCQRHWQHFQRHHPEKARNFTALEVGTGWYPVVPLGLYLCGAREIRTYDIDPLLTTQRLAVTMKLFEGYVTDGRLKKIVPGALPERIEKLRQLYPHLEKERAETWLARLGIHVHVADASRTGLPSNSVDFFVSTGVLEYIPRDVLTALFADFRRMATEGAVMSHYLNLVDQYSYFDRNIGPLNFLKFTNRQWRYLNSPITWLNRLRISDYRAMVKNAGFVIVAEENETGADEVLRHIRLAPEFAGYSKADLLVLTSLQLAKLAPVVPHEASNTENRTPAGRT